MLQCERNLMSSIRQTLTQLNGFRGKFSRLMADIAETQPHMGHRTECRLSALAPNGTNAGNLRMYVYVPDQLPSNPPLVVALHGCGQTASDYDRGTGWSRLADRHGFVVLFPEQQTANNPKRCFSWFQPGDTGRDLGEARSIHEMVEQAIASFRVDRRRVSITGLSAGGAMAAVMLATYPEVYSSGAIIAGLPYGSARTVQEAFDVMFNDQEPSPRALGDRVRAASQHEGPWPRVSVWHGTDDKIVRPSNAENIVKQWSNVHQLPLEHSRLEALGPHTRRIWADVDGNRRIEAISVAGMGHGVPLATKATPDALGVPGPFFLDVGLPSTVHIAQYFGVVDGLVAEGVQSEAGSSRELETATRSADPGEAPRENAHAQHQARSLSPNSVIAAAFQAAGLPVPSVSRGTQGVDPTAIISATLKAAGLWRR
jgi:poly(hydroxyalkanoate) depolymerase family esterase